MMLALTLAARSLAQPLPAIDEGSPEPPPPLTLEALAATSDVVALVQVADTDYEYAREFPVGGTAYLKVLIPYRVTEPIPGIIPVYEEGLHPFECYFPDPSVLEEGRRYIVFLRKNPEVQGQFLRLAQGCALTVLVMDGNGYALRYPLNGMAVSGDFASAAQPMMFRDNYAVLSDDDLRVDERNALLEQNLLIRRDDGAFKLTHGIPLSQFRNLLGQENLTTNRALLRPLPDDF